MPARAEQVTLAQSLRPAPSVERRCVANAGSVVTLLEAIDFRMPARTDRPDYGSMGVVTCHL